MKLWSIGALRAVAAVGTLAILAALGACADDETGTPSSSGTSSSGTSTGQAGSGGEAGTTGTGAQGGTGGIGGNGGGGASLPGAYTGPIMIAASNYQQLHGQLEPLRPFVVYAWATDPAIQAYDQQIATLAAINDADVRKMVMFSSHATMAAKLGGGGHAQYLQSIGVDLLGYNTEGGMTPQNELSQVDNPNGSQNSVAVFVATADSFGSSFEVWWGPIRAVSDSISDPALTAMFGAGLDGVGLQEQLPIEASCAADRIAAVEATANRYRNIPGGQGCRINVQVMSSRCANGDGYAQSQCPAETIAEDYDHCDLFIDGIAPGIDSMAIWASGPDDINRLPGFVQKMRTPEP